VGAFLIAGAFRGSAFAAAQKKFRWRLQSVFHAGSLTYYGLGTKFKDDLLKRTDGRIEISLFPAGALAKPMETFDLTAAGAVDMALGVGLYQARKMPEALVETGLPMSYTGRAFSMEGPNQSYEFLYEFKGGEAMRLLRQAYDEKGTYLLTVGASSAYHFMTTFPVKTLEDFKGKKIRSIGLYSQLVKNMGASPVSLAGAEQYMALQRGTVDGTIYTTYTLDAYKLKEVLDYVVVPPVNGCICINFYVNKKAWNALPGDLKKILQDTGLEAFRWFSREVVKADFETMQDASKVGVQVAELPEEEYEKLRKLAAPIWDSAAKKSERTAKLVSLLREYLKYKGILK
jgi:TRAP-type C4-dicarboxylate transport system substrate-binding protein